MHHGFSESQMREIFTAAGAGTDFKLEHIGGGFTIASHGHHKEGEGIPASEAWDDEAKDGSGEKGESESSGKDKEAFRREVFFARGTKGGA